MDNASAQHIWNDFLALYHEYASYKAPKIIRFYDNETEADRCASLISKGVKRAHTYSLLGFQNRGESIPKVGDFTIVVNWSNTAICIVRTTSVKLLPYSSIHEEHSRLQGEGNKSLDYWKKTHWSYFGRELARFGRTPKESMIVIFERFEKIFEREIAQKTL